MPARVQLKRAHARGLPPDTVRVDHTTKWGSPFVPGRDNPLLPGRIVEDRRHAWSLYLGFAPLNAKLVAAARAELRGKDLACSCALPGPYENDCCHASILLQLANSTD